MLKYMQIYCYGGFMKRTAACILTLILLFLCACTAPEKNTAEEPEKQEQLITPEIDELAHNQWYLFSEYNAEVELFEQYEITDGFAPINTTRINSEVDIGIWDYLSKTHDYGDAEITVALIDSSVDVHHEDLAGNLWHNEGEIPGDGIDNDANGFTDDVNGWNFITDSNALNANISEFSHGTHCAGIISALHNGIGTMGIAGSAPVKLMVLPAVEKGDDSEEIENVISAIHYAEKMGAKICSLSCSFDEYSSELETVMAESEMVFVVSAGNFQSGFIGGLDLEKYPRYPACFVSENIITVSNLTHEGKLAPSSNYGSKTVDIAAPGELIYSTLPNNTYGFNSGTSMAVPVVSAVLALYALETGGNITEAVQLLQKNATDCISLEGKVTGNRVVCFK